MKQQKNHKKTARMQLNKMFIGLEWKRKKDERSVNYSTIYLEMLENLLNAKFT